MQKIVILYILASYLFFIGLPPLAYSNDLTTNHINVHPLNIEEKFNTDRVSASIRDNDGFLWLATDNGLKRYDGYGLRVFTPSKNNTTSIGSSNITALLLKKSGGLWVAGDTLSLYRSETEAFDVFHITNNATIWTFHEDKQGILWVGGKGFGLLGFDINKKEVTHRFFTDNKTNIITSIASKGTSAALWVSTNSGLYTFDTLSHKITAYALPLDYIAAEDVIKDVTEDKNGNLWLATHQGLIVLNPQTKQSKTYLAKAGTSGGIKSNSHWSVFEDSKGDIWVGTDKQGVYRYHPKMDSFSHYSSSVSNPHSFPPTSIKHIFEDNEGTLWFSAGASGAYRITEHLEKFTTLQHSENSDNSLTYNNTLDLLEDSNGSIWIATDGGGLDRYNPKNKTFIHYKHDPKDPFSLSGNSVLSLAEDKDGFIWVGTWGAGLNKLDPATGKFTHIKRNPYKNDKNSLLNNNIFRIDTDKKGNLYLSLWTKGLQIYNPKDKTFETFTHNDGSNISNTSINDFLITEDGKYWIAGYRGLELFDPKTKTFTPMDILSGIGVVYDIHMGKSGILWLATSKSLIRYHPAANTIKKFTTKDGLADNFVVSIESGNKNDLWLGTRQGLSRFSPVTEEFTTFTEDDGLAGNLFNPYSHLRTKSGNMYFGGPKGLSIFNPKYVPSNNTAPKVHLTDFQLSQTSVIPLISPWLDRSINKTKRIQIPHNQQDILFEFSALNLISPAKNSYKYKLKGLESEWIKANSNQRRARYTNLSPGHYTFQVLGSNNEGVWAGEAKEVDLIILPAWWQTWWAFIIYVFMLFGVIYGFSYWRLKLNRAHQKDLELIVKQRTLDLKKANNSINQLNSELEQRVFHRTKELSIEMEERKQAEERSSHIAFHDPLTGLPNRSWLLQHLEDLIQQASNDDFKFALFFIGGDRFKQLNDYGLKVHRLMCSD